MKIVVKLHYTGTPVIETLPDGLMYFRYKKEKLK